MGKMIWLRPSKNGTINKWEYVEIRKKKIKED